VGNKKQNLVYTKSNRYVPYGLLSHPVHAKPNNIHDRSKSNQIIMPQASRAGSLQVITVPKRLKFSLPLSLPPYFTQHTHTKKKKEKKKGW
jgi:hypothetical protein